MARKEIEAILVIVLGLMAVYFFSKNSWWLWLGFGVGVVSLIIPMVGNLIVKGWFRVGEGLGWINSRILLAVIFYGLLTPLALMYRWTKKDELKLRKNESTSMFVTRNQKFTKADLEKMW